MIRRGTEPGLSLPGQASFFKSHGRFLDLCIPIRLLLHTVYPWQIDWQLSFVRDPSRSIKDHLVHSATMEDLPRALVMELGPARPRQLQSAPLTSF